MVRTLLLVAMAAGAAGEGTAGLLSRSEANGLAQLLNTSAAFIVAKMAPDQPPIQADRSIFEYGNLARVLLAGHRITGNPEWLKVGLDWCDGFVAAQLPVTTPGNGKGGYWDTGYREIFIADTGTAVVTLTVCIAMQSDSTKVEGYKAALERYALFVTKGCLTPPTNPNVTGIVGPAGCPAADGEGWVIQSGADKGALGDGWYKRELNSGAYTISTATSGSCGFVQMDVLGLKPLAPSTAVLSTVAADAIDWLLNSRTPDGRIPYIIHPADTTSVVFQPITYSAESFITCGLHYPAMKQKLSTLKSTVEWLVANQNPDGSWGKWSNLTVGEDQGVRFSPSGDAQRSPRALSLIQWYLATYGPDPSIEESIHKFVAFLLDDAKAKAFGVNTNSTAGVLVTGFVGLAVADLIQPWVTF
eukprot:m.453364 g.453364  ORF g.453364 m.453364 type:complete len:416 (-) comp20483_c0_seq1:130-1377(-)